MNSYSGGMVQLVRQFNAKAYRYGFNGQEKDLDPRPNPAVSPYAVLGNNPIWYSDSLGDMIIVGEKY